MKSLFSRILLAQVIAVVLALVVVTLITRVSLNRGFQAFLDRQETTVLQTVAPALADYYENQGGWDQVRNNPGAWMRIWRFTRTGEPVKRGPRQGQQRGRPQQPPGPGPADGPAPDLRWLANPGRGALRERLFLLDENRERVAGAAMDDTGNGKLEAIVVGGETVGWIGIAPMGQVLPPDAERFLERQVTIMIAALAVALAFAALLAWVLARNVSRPVQRIGSC